MSHSLSYNANNLSVTWDYKPKGTNDILEQNDTNLRLLISQLFSGLMYADIAQVINEGLGNTIDQCPISDHEHSFTRR